MKNLPDSLWASGLLIAFLGGCGPASTPLSPNNSPNPTNTPTVIPAGTPTKTPTPHANGGVVSTYVGDDSCAFGATNPHIVDNGFVGPAGVAVDSSGNLYVVDDYENCVFKVSSGSVSVLAGKAGYAGGFANGTGTSAQFYAPYGLTVDSQGYVYVADSDNDMIRKISPGGTVSTVAGQAGVTGCGNGPASISTFAYPNGVAVDSSGNLYVADSQNDVIRKITPGGTVSTFFGQAGVTGTGSNLLNYPIGVAVDSSGNLYVADVGNNRVQVIPTSGSVTATATAPAPGAWGIAVGSNGTLEVISDQGFVETIQDINSAPVTSLLAGQYAAGFANGTGAAAKFNNPSGIAVDSYGDVFVADNSNGVVREIQ